MSRLRSRKGFSLIELLIVVVIIGILATILISRFSGAKEAAYVASINSVAQQLSQAVMAYNSLQTDGNVANTIAEVQTIAEDLALTMDQVTLTAGDTWLVDHSQTTAQATVNATTGVLTAAVLP